MARLVLINGAPGSGKSTLARRFAEEHPLTLALDVDVVRGLVGGWLQAPDEAGVLARQLAVSMARTHLAAGHDVVVAQYLGRVAFVETLEQLARQLGVAFIELALLSDHDDVVRRFSHRSANSPDPVHQQAAELQRRNGGPRHLAAAYDQLCAVVEARPRTRVLQTVDGDVDGTYAQLLQALKS